MQMLFHKTSLICCFYKKNTISLVSKRFDRSVSFIFRANGQGNIFGTRISSWQSKRDIRIQNRIPILLATRNVAQKLTENNSVPRMTIERTPLQRLMRAKDYADFIFIAVLLTGIYMAYQKYKKEKDNELTLNLEWIQVPKMKQKMFCCSGYYFPEYLAKSLKQFKTFDVKKDDVWVVSFPKSGTTWVQDLVYLIMNDCDFKKASANSIDLRAPFLEFPTPGLNQINRMTSPRILKTHLPYCFLPDDVENKSKVIYIVRNPKDVCVSFYHFFRMMSEVDYKGQFEDFFDLFINKTVPYGPWWKHVDEYTSKKNIHIISYEDLHKNPTEAVSSLCKFLGKELTSDQMKSVIDWCSFDNMKKNPAVNYSWYQEIGLFKKEGNFFRNGKIGDWLGHFSRSMSKDLDRVVAENLKYPHKFDYGISEQELAKIYSVDAAVVSSDSNIKDTK